jgi:hypothetical protein
MLHRNLRDPEAERMSYMFTGRKMFLGRLGLRVYDPTETSLETFWF